MQCVTPPVPSGVSTIEMLIGSASGSVAGVHLFEFQAAAFVYAALPRSGPVAGGTEVSLNGQDFSLR
jgi:hypothetical protein